MLKQRFPYSAVVWPLFGHIWQTYHGCFAVAFRTQASTLFVTGEYEVFWDVTYRSDNPIGMEFTGVTECALKYRPLDRSESANKCTSFPY